MMKKKHGVTDEMHLAKRSVPSSPDRNSGYMVQLDGLRAIAVSFVLLHHFYSPLHDYLGGALGTYGIKLFFVLSGFLITGILLDARSLIERHEISKGFAFRQFYIRRTLRIFPAYYLILFISLVAGNPDVRSDIWWYATYTTNILVASRGWFGEATAHLWRHCQSTSA